MSIIQPLGGIPRRWLVIVWGSLE